MEFNFDQTHSETEIEVQQNRKMSKKVFDVSQSTLLNGRTGLYVVEVSKAEEK